MDKLYFRKLGTGKPIVILHGLYGSSDNWMSVGKILSKNYTVYLVDLRNHGQSFKHNVHDYESMSNDIVEFVLENNLTDIILIGHSMGGKVAIDFTIKKSEIVKRLIIVDISPFDYSGLILNKHKNSHIYILNSLKSIDIKNLSQRNDIEISLKYKIKDTAIRQFLMKNLKREKEGIFFWAINIDVLLSNIDKLMKGITIENFIFSKIKNKTMFIKGSNSDYITSSDIQKIDITFSNYKILEIKDSGHWIHYEKQKEFLETVIEFIS